MDLISGAGSSRFGGEDTEGRQEGGMKERSEDLERRAAQVRD
jgi:hypothetical protein